MKKCILIKKMNGSKTEGKEVKETQLKITELKLLNDKNVINFKK